MMTVKPMTRSAAVTLDSRRRFTREGWRRVRVTTFSISIRHSLQLIPGPNYARGKLSISRCPRTFFTESRQVRARACAVSSTSDISRRCRGTKENPPANAPSTIPLTRSPAQKGSIGGVIMDFSFALSFPARRPMTTVYKIPCSVLVVIHTPDLQVLMMERAGWKGFWQSVTGSLAHESESPRDAAIREVREETGLDAGRYDLRDWGIENRFEIFKKHRSRYAPGITHNLERVFSLSLPEPLPVKLDPAEHLSYEWLPWREAAALTISWTNRDAILALPQRLGVSAR